MLGSLPVLAAVETLTYAAACTERLRLGCAVFVTPLHNPVHLAKSLSTLDQLGRGRLEVGVGTGGRGRMFPAFGVDPDRLVGRCTEGLQQMKALWTEPAVTFDGRFWQLDGAGMQPKPFQKPHPPVWFGGNHPNALRRAIRHGDGFFGAVVGPPDACVRWLQEVADAGAELILLNPLFDQPSRWSASPPRSSPTSPEPHLPHGRAASEPPTMRARKG